MMSESRDFAASRHFTLRGQKVNAENMGDKGWYITGPFSPRFVDLEQIEEAVTAGRWVELGGTFETPEFDPGYSEPVRKEHLMTADDVTGWLERNELFEPTHEEAMVLVREIARLNADTDLILEHLSETAEKL